MSQNDVMGLVRELFGALLQTSKTGSTGSLHGLRAHKLFITGEFDPGSERTLAARLTHASRTRKLLRE